jgi:hypothetical protein
MRGAPGLLEKVPISPRGQVLPRFPLVLLLLAILAFGVARPARAEDPAACLAAAKTGWSAPEAWVWGQICAGKPADFVAGLAGTPSANDLSARFMSALLFDPELRNQVPHYGVHIAGAYFGDALALGNAAPGFELALERSDFQGNVDFHGLSDAEEVSFAGSRFASLLDLDGAKFGANLKFNDGAEAAYISMVRTTIGGSADLNTITVSRGLNLERLSVAHNLSIRGSHLPGISLLGASVTGDLTLRDSTITGWAWLENLQIGSDLFLQNAKWEHADLPGSTIAGNLLMTGISLTGPLNMKGIKVGGDLAMDGKAEFKAIALQDGDIGYNLRLDSSHIAGLLSAPAIHVGHLLALGPLSTFDGEVRLEYARIDGGIVMTHSTFAKAVNLDGITIGQSLQITDDARIVGALQMTFAHVGANVDLTAGSFNSVDLTGTTIGAEIRLASKGYATIAWGPKAHLILRNVSAKALQDLPDAWPTELDLEGFTYQQLGGYRQASGADDVTARDASTFVDWLAKQPVYSPQPYRTLSDVLRTAGYADKAKQVLYAGSLREWHNATGIAWVWQAMRWAIIGFGLYPQRAGIWILVLVPLGAFVFGFDPAVRLRAMRFVDRLFYSFDALLPFVTLRIEHAAFDLQSWPKYYLYFHKVMGYVLIAFLLAALTGTS